MKLTTAQMDRAVGAVLGMATGDALGAGYEFQPVRPAGEIDMIGGGLGPFEPGEWTDDTSMAMPILRALASGKDLLATHVQDEIAQSWVDWTHEARDIGTTVSVVLHQSLRPASASAVTEAAHAMFAAGGRAAGNGSLMRTTPIVLGFLDDPDGLSVAARTYSDMTHGDPEAGDACVLWNHAQRRAILSGEFDITDGLRYVPAERRAVWSERIEQAESECPDKFSAHNGWVVRALQSAWSAICTTRGDGPDHFEWGLRNVIAAGGDADTVAAIAGGLLGARWGVSAIPLRWRRRLHGWPGSTGQGLVHDSVAAVTGTPWPATFYDHIQRGPDPVRLPQDPGVWIGDVFALPTLPQEIGAVVSLCRVGSAEGPSHVHAEDHIHVWLTDSDDPVDNQHLGFVAEDAVNQIRELRDCGKSVFVHCVQAHSRTPFIAALYGARVSGTSSTEALNDVLDLLPRAAPNRAFCDYLAAH